MTTHTGTREQTKQELMLNEKNQVLIHLPSNKRGITLTKLETSGQLKTEITRLKKQLKTRNDKIKPQIKKFKILKHNIVSPYI